MKIKTIVLSVILILFAICNTAFAQDEIMSFAQCLRECKGYFGSETIDLSSIKMTTTKQILGFNGGKCTYKEHIKTKDASYTVNCTFTKAQINELADEIDKFESNPDNQNIDVNDMEQVQNASVSQAWSKYLMDGNVCTLEHNNAFILNTEKTQSK